MKQHFLPEGQRLQTPENQRQCGSLHALSAAMESNRILEGRALVCDAEHNLIVQVGPFTGVIPRQEAALGIAEGKTKDIAILSRVGKPVCFTVSEISNTSPTPNLILSRQNAQRIAWDHMLNNWCPDMIVPAVVTHLEHFGAFVDIGCGIISMIGIENISISRIPHPCCRFTTGQKIFALVTNVDPSTMRISLSHKELLGTWAENVSSLTPGMTVTGYVRSIKHYGIFVELFPNLSGLAEPADGYQIGDRVSVYIKAILPDRHKIKLRILERLHGENNPAPLTYFRQSGMLVNWNYHAE